jgi:NAD dependent epimerase/dehydratase family enzyme
MKIVLSGCTGFIGGEVLAQCRCKASITSIVVLTRRELSEEISNDPKVVPVIIEDFLNYSDEVKGKMAGASAAIW